MKKCIFFLAWLGIFVLSIAGIIFAVYPNFYSSFNISPLNLKLTILNLSIVYLVLTLLKVKSKFPKKADFKIDTESGKVVISSESIKSMVKEILSSEEGIHLTKVETREVGRKYNVILHIESSMEINLAEKTASIQEKVKKIIKQNIGIDINDVEIRLLKINKQHQ